MGEASLKRDLKRIKEFEEFEQVLILTISGGIEQNSQELSKGRCIQNRVLSIQDIQIKLPQGLIHSYDVSERENPRNVYMLSWLVRELQSSFGVGQMILDFAQEHSIFNVLQVDASICREDVYVSISDVEECVELVQLLWGVFNHAIKK